MAATRSNARYLPERPFPERLELTSSLEQALNSCAVALVVVPSEAFRCVLEQVAEHLPPDARVAWATKGFEPGTGRLLNDVAGDVLAPGSPTAILSGPTFALEVAAGLPGAVTLASSCARFGADLRDLFHTPRFRVYTSTDLIGVQVGGAVKNVLAIAAGIADGLGFGANTRAALITRGLAELMRLGVALGGQPETFMGLAGLGDLVLTCTDDQSRNRRAGLAIARGRSMARIRQDIGQAIEGMSAAREALRRARELGVDVPITEQVDQVLNGNVGPEDAVNALLSRSAGPEVR
jgi:glycerol-3-phosphate dehydrogenase (NAD(P)+)